MGGTENDGAETYNDPISVILYTIYLETTFYHRYTATNFLKFMTTHFLVYTQIAVIYTRGPSSG